MTRQDMPAVQIRIKAVPGSSREAIEMFGDLVKVRVKAPPEKGKANTAIEKLLAGVLGLPTTAVSITAGFTSSCKTVSISGYTSDRLQVLLTAAAESRSAPGRS